MGQGTKIEFVSVKINPDDERAPFCMPHSVSQCYTSQLHGRIQ